MTATPSVSSPWMPEDDLLLKNSIEGLDTPATYSERPLPVEVGSVKMNDPELMDNTYISDQYNSDSDGDIPYFSDVEAMILEMDLAHTQESCILSEVARYQYEGTKRMIIRLEQSARSSFERTMSSQGALAIFYGRHLMHYIKKAEVTIGRSTDDTEVDIDLRKEGRANKISRRQATIKMEADGSFNLKNLGASSISLNGKDVARGQVVALGSSCLIEIRGMCFVFEINDKYVRRFLDSQPR
ncbi:Forkhead-associated (FHA) domain-containing protein [Cynara cardunculus var. scolymus]|uniref:Forkhead-associated (FHA) domain-containing protein n=1 Tax=Cynara cardunculus var. scolymus TaxID=59895 RepID=A0A103YGS2_CYNCS|nr:Forkhead-associated (FHA) domain-containing protein [Cynara cardunculus var. scolymus]